MGDRPVRCPCCGQAIEQPIDVGQVKFLQRVGVPRELLSALVQAYPEPVPTGRLIERSYSHRPDGGPLAAANIISVTVTRMRKKLEPYGWTISTGHHGGYRLARLN